MLKQDFIEARLARWRRLESLLDRLESTGPHKLEQHDLEEFVHLYRMACSDLARARSEDLGDEAEGYLNALIARGHKQYRPPGPPDLRRLGRFFAEEFPRAVRRHGRYVLAATLLFVVPLALAALAVARDPAVAYNLAPPEQLEMLTDAYAEGHAGGRSESEDSLMTGFYVHNNVGIAFRCFATGIFFGLGSIFFLILNGVSGGAVGAFVCSAGYWENFLSFVVGHGAFELTAIVLSGAMGLRLGFLLVDPGPLRRADALRVHGPAMIEVILGAAAMLLAAALIEGFWSPSDASATVKFAVGGALWALVLGYLSLAGRRGPLRAKRSE
ncbi:MAG: stage II sporulation protein M [Polyangia bacterium]